MWSFLVMLMLSSGDVVKIDIYGGYEDQRACNEARMKLYLETPLPGKGYVLAFKECQPAPKDT